MANLKTTVEGTTVKKKLFIFIKGLNMFYGIVPHTKEIIICFLMSNIRKLHMI